MSLEIHIGTCSWKYDAWRGLVYSAAVKPNYLQEYAQHYDTVEVDQWFWSLAGLTENMTSHCLRHFFISRAVESGISSLVIARWVGHAATRMIEQIYAHLSPEFRNGEMRKIQLGLGNGNGRDMEKKSA